MKSPAIRFLSAIFAAGMLVSLVSCEKKPPQPGSSSPTASVQSSSSNNMVKTVELPKRVPESLGMMKMNQVFYKPAQSESVCYVNTAYLSPDLIASLRTLQGLVARTSSAGIFLDNGSENDAFWRGYCLAEYGVIFEETSVNDVFIRYKDLIKKIVVYKSSTKTDYEFNMAQNIASLYDGIVATKSVLSSLEDLGIKPEVDDVSGRWKSKKAAYEYALTDILPHCSGNYISFSDEKSDFNDYIYATQSFSCNLSADVKSEKEILSKMVSLERYQLPAVAFGQSSPSKTLTQMLSVAGFTHINTADFKNATFFASVPNDMKSYPKNKVSNKKAKNGKIYVSIFIANQNLGSYESSAVGIWDSKKVKVPVSMQFSPALYELAPPIANWFLQNRVSTDEIIASCSGWGAVDETLIPEKIYDIWHLTNNYFLNACGINTICANKLFSSGEDMSRFGSFSDAKGIILNSPSISSGTLAMSNKVPVISRKNFSKADDFIKWLDELQPDPNQPLFYAVQLPPAMFENGAYENVNTLVADVESSREKIYEFLLTGDLFETASSWYALNQKNAAASSAASSASLSSSINP